MHRECEQQPWTETHPAIAPRVVWATVIAAVGEHGPRLLAQAPAQSACRPAHRHRGVTEPKSIDQLAF
jgi:hypothetical protein